MEDGRKRKAGKGQGGHAAKKSKPWMVPRKGQPGYIAPSIETGDAGIWATCEMNREAKSQAQLLDLFEEYATKLYGESINEQAIVSDEDAEVDIEAEIQKEVQGLKSKSRKKEALFQPVKMDIQCVLFFKTRAPIEPVTFVHRICKDASEGTSKRIGFVKKLTPMTMMGKATPEGLEKVANAVLKPIFHAEDTKPKKFAIRPNKRNHNVMSRDEIIKQIASLVGGSHSVDLKNYDNLIMVDVYRNIIGMSVVGSDFEDLKQYNLAEIYDPTPKPDKDIAENHSPITAGCKGMEPTLDSKVPDEESPANAIPNSSTADDTVAVEPAAGVE